MSVQALWTSIPRFQHPSYCPALAEPLHLRLQHGFMPQRFLSPHMAQSISVSVHVIRSAFLVMTPLQTLFWISNFAMRQGLGLSLPANRSFHHSRDDVIRLTALSI
jgi:hypothetical protein